MQRMQVEVPSTVWQLAQLGSAAQSFCTQFPFPFSEYPGWQVQI
jgi:hypothetical protein